MFMIQYVKSDLFRYYGKSGGMTFIKAIIRNGTFRFQFVFRMCQAKGILKLRRSSAAIIQAGM